MANERTEWVESKAPEFGLCSTRLCETNRFEARMLRGATNMKCDVVHVFTKLKGETRTPPSEVMTITNGSHFCNEHASDWHTCYRDSREFHKEMDSIFDAMDKATKIEQGGWRDVYFVGQLQPLLEEILDRLEDAVSLDDVRMEP